MTKEEAKKVLTEMQRWRRALPPYDDVPCEMPYKQNEFGEAIDVAIEALK